MNGGRYVNWARLKVKGELKVVELEEELLFRVGFMSHRSFSERVHSFSGWENSYAGFKFRFGLGA